MGHEYVKIMGSELMDDGAFYDLKPQIQWNFSNVCIKQSNREYNTVTI